MKTPTGRASNQKRSNGQLPKWLLAKRTIEIAEAALGVAAIGLLDYFLPPQLGLQQYDLYLLWVVVLGIAARYGAPAGYVVSILAAITFDALIYLDTNPYAAVSPHEAIQPFLLFTSGILVSEIVRSHKKNAEQAKAQLQEAKKNVQIFKEQYTAITEVKNELERRIANQPISVATVSEFAMRMNGLRPQELYPTVLALLRTMLDVEACSLYLVDNRQLRLMVGQPDGFPARPAIITTENTLAQRVIRERQVITIRDLLRQHGPTHTPQLPGIMAGPLIGRDGRLLGIVVIERLPFFNFTPATIRLFEQLLSWIASALENAAMLESLQMRVR